MNPRKKSKPNLQASADGSCAGPDVPADASTPTTATTTSSASEVFENTPSKKSVAGSTSSSDGATTPTTSGTQTPRGRKWLNGTGSWRSKAPALVQTAKESIGVSGGATIGQESKKPRDDSPTKFLTKRKSSKGDALPTSITKVHVSSDGLTEESSTSAPTDNAKEAPASPAPIVDEPPLPPIPSPAPPAEQAANTWAWRSWWSRPDGYLEASKAKSETHRSIEDAQSTPLPGPTPSEEPDAITKGLENTGVTDIDGQANGKGIEGATTQEAQTDDAETQGASDKAQTKNTTSSSWFWSWSKAQNAQANPPPVEPIDNASMPEAGEAQGPASAPQPSEELQEPQISEETATLQTSEGTTETASATTSALSKPSAWAFWYRGKSDEGDKLADGEAQKHVGEVAVYNTPSQSNPEAAQFNEAEQPRTETEDPKKLQQSPKQDLKGSKDSIAKRSFRSLRGRTKAKDAPSDISIESSASSKAATPTKSSPVLEPTRPETAPAAQPAPKQPTKTKQEPSNLLLPEFKTTYRLVQQPNFWQQVRHYFLGNESPMPHLHINPAPPKIKKAVAIGVHGFFPAPILQKVLGQPTGTSIRFANAAAAAIKDWADTRGYSPEIEQIALEGEGFIAERVNSLWKLLLNWIEHIKQADFILIACHSQGVPVAMMLLAKLIQFGCVSTTRIGICAMAGVNMGPFIEYKTKYFGPTAAELFEFSNPKSLVSQMYLAALDEALRFGVRILYVGSIDDQLVSLEVRTLFPSNMCALLTQAL
jgi:hypothetical protein